MDTHKDDESVDKKKKKKKRHVDVETNQATMMMAANKKKRRVIVNDEKAKILRSFSCATALVEENNNNNNNNGEDHQLWKDLPLEWKYDPDIALEAWKAGCIRDWTVLRFYGLTIEYLSKAFQEKRIQWEQLPGDVTTEKAFFQVLSPALLDEFLAVQLAILYRRRELANSRDFWLEFICSSPLDRRDFRQTLRFFLSDEVKADREVMLKAIQRDIRILEDIADTPLGRDVNFISAVLDCNPYALKYVNHDFQISNRDLVVASFPRIHEWDTHNKDKVCAELAKRIAPELWGDRSVAEAWFAAGLPYYNRVFPKSWKKDKHLFLLFATNCRQKHWYYRFSFADETLLRDNESFMMRAVEQNPLLLHFASSASQNLFLLAFATSVEFGRDFLNRDCSFSKKTLNHRRKFAKEFKHHVTKKLQLHDKFVNVVLCGVYSRDSAECPLSMLNQGDPEKGAPPHMKVIAEYLGVPIGKELRLYRRAHANLSNVHIPGQS